MLSDVTQINMALAWLWITFGILFGFILGNFFHIDDWKGGYASFKRRLYRLAHISFFGTAILNLLFFFSVRSLTGRGAMVDVASWGFIVGAITMPACCLIMAHNPKLRAIFVVPVICLFAASGITFWKALVP